MLDRRIGAVNARQLKRLAVSAWSDRAAERLASAANLAGLEGLRVSMQTGADSAGAGRRPRRHAAGRRRPPG